MKYAACILFGLFFTLVPAETRGIEYNCTDSEILALEFSQAVSPPEDLVSRIAGDLQAVRQFDPFFDQIVVRPSWIPSELRVLLTPEAMQDFLEGIYHGLDELNDLYGPVVMDQLFGSDYLVVTFDLCYSPPELAEIYGEANGVVTATPNVSMLDGHDIELLDLVLNFSRYEYRYGWMDCESGCIYSHYWLINVVGGNVEIVDEYGDPIVVPVQGLSWSAVKGVFR